MADAHVGGPAAEPGGVRPAPRGHGRRLALGLGSLLVLLVGAEFGARLAGWGPPEDGLVYLGDEELVFELAPDQRVEAGSIHPEQGDTRHLVSVDEYGRRRTGKRLEHLGGGAFRVVVLGDSLTFGPGVNDDRTYATQLERALSEPTAAVQIDVLNAGVNGYSTFHYSRWAEHRLAEVDADLLVVALYVGNDNELDLEARVQVAVPAERWIWRSALGFAFREAWRERRWKERRTQRGPMDRELPEELLPLAGKRQHELELKDQRKLWQHGMGHLAEVRDFAAAADVPMVVLLVPVHWELNIEHESDAHVFLRDRLAAIDVPVITVLDALRPVKDTCWLTYDTGHLSRSGHEVVGAALARDLRGGGFLDVR